MELLKIFKHDSSSIKKVIKKSLYLCTWKIVKCFTIFNLSERMSMHEGTSNIGYTRRSNGWIWRGSNLQIFIPPSFGYCLFLKKNHLRSWSRCSITRDRVCVSTFIVNKICEVKILAVSEQFILWEFQLCTLIYRYYISCLGQADKLLLTEHFFAFVFLVGYCFLEHHTLY